VTTVRIVSARSDDLGRYIDLLEEVADWLAARGIKQWRPGNFRLSAGYYAQSIELGEVQLAFIGDELVGTLRFLLHEPIVWPEIVEADAVYVYNLAVRRAWASKRLGSQMLEWAEDRARSLGRKYVRLDCMSDNHFLREYYVQAGFEERGEIDAPFPAPVGTLRLRRYEKPVKAPMSLHVHIRPEEHGDVRDIWHITKQAFAGRPYADGTEQDIIDLLRDQGALAISLVAEYRGKVVGHVAFSPAVPEDLSSGWYTLGPVSVQPDVQRQGIGKALIRAGIARLRELDAAGCIVLGDTNYYSQFGFDKAPELAPSGEPAEYFMVLCLGSQVPECKIGFHHAFHHVSKNKG